MAPEATRQSLSQRVHRFVAVLAEHVEPIPDGVVLMRGLHDNITVAELSEALRKALRAPDNSGS